MTTSSQRTKSTTSSGTAFSGREDLEFSLQLSASDRILWLARRLEAYRDACVHFAAVVTRVRSTKVTVAEAEAQAVMETDGFTKAIVLESPLYPAILAAAEPPQQLEAYGGDHQRKNG